MAETPLLIICLALVYILCLITIGIFLFYRSIKTELYNLRVLAFAFFGFVLDFLLIFLGAPSYIINIAVNLCFILMTIFTYLTFYKGRKKLLIIFLGLVIVLRIVDCIARWNYNFTTPLATPLTPESRPYFYIFQVAVRGEFTIATGWLAYASLSTYRKQKNIEAIEPWIKNRYLILGVGALVYLLQDVLVLLLPVDGTGYTSPQGIWMGILLLLVSIFFGVSQLIGWIMPAKLKAYFNRGFDSSPEDPHDELSEEELMKKLLEEE